MAKQLNKSAQEKQKILAFLDAEDIKVPSNPGLFSDIEKNRGDFDKLFEDSVKEQDFNVGDVVTGTVVEVQTDYALVDINYKSEGLISLSEFRIVDGVREIKPGDKIEVLIDRIENENGMIVLSKDKADMLRAWSDISKAAENEEVIEGTVVAKVKG
ncbi:MAG: S1 RNA-binding domain-containing protein, partial [Pseudobdellovibrionaceae bacterium]